MIFKTGRYMVPVPGPNEEEYRVRVTLRSRKVTNYFYCIELDNEKCIALAAQITKNGGDLKKAKNFVNWAGTKKLLF